MRFMSVSSGGLQSPRPSKFKEDFSPEEPMVADDEGLHLVNGFVAGPPYHLLGADGPKPATEDAGFIRRHKHNLSNISNISNASSISEASLASNESDISSPSNGVPELADSMSGWYGPTQAQERGFGSPASSFYSVQSPAASPSPASNSPAPVDVPPSWPLPSSMGKEFTQTTAPTNRMLLVRDESRPLSASSYASRYGKFSSSTTSLVSRNSDMSMPESPLHVSFRNPLGIHMPTSSYLEPPSPQYPNRRSSLSRQNAGRPISQTSETSQTSQMSQTSSVFEEDLPPPPRRRFSHRKNSSLSSIKRLVPLYEDRVQDASRPKSMSKKWLSSSRQAPKRPPRPEQGLDFPFHSMGDVPQSR